MFPLYRSLAYIVWILVWGFYEIPVCVNCVFLCLCVFLGLWRWLFSYLVVLSYCDLFFIYLFGLYLIIIPQMPVIF